MASFFPEPRQNRSGRGDKKDNGFSKSGNQRSEGGDPEGRISNWQFIYELAGIVGVDPKPFTLKKLFWMAEAKERSEWNRFSVLIAKLHNVNQTKKSDLISFEQAHPFYLQQANQPMKQTEPTKSELAMARSLIGRH